MKKLFEYTIDPHTEQGLLIGCIFASILGLFLTLAELMFHLFEVL